MVKTARARLWNVAVDQYGYVTTADAHGLGIAVVELGKLHARGKLERPGYGIYRFPEFPVSARDPYMLAVLWAGGRGVLSDGTALEVYELCDVNPDRIHLTVPPGYRPRREGGHLYVVHHRGLSQDERGWWEGIPTITPATAIRQAVEGAVPRHLATQALATGRAQGVITAAEADELGARLRGAG
jgi:predicted transcriptional regulator of viral defense system